MVYVRFIKVLLVLCLLLSSLQHFDFRHFPLQHHAELLTLPVSLICSHFRIHKTSAVLLSSNCTIMVLRLLDNTSRRSCERFHTAQHIEFAGVEPTTPVADTAEQRNGPERLGPWPLRRNPSSRGTLTGSETAAASSSSLSIDSGLGTRVGTPEAERDNDTQDKTLPKKSDFTITMERVDSQCESIRQILDAERATTINTVAEVELQGSERNIAPQQQPEVIGRNGGVADVENTAAASSQSVQDCPRCVKPGCSHTTLVVAFLAFMVATALIYASPVIFVEAFMDTSIPDRNPFADEEAKKKFRRLLYVPVIAVQVVISIAYYSLLELQGAWYPQSRQVKRNLSDQPMGLLSFALTSCVIFAGVMYIVCELLLSEWLRDVDEGQGAS